MENRGPTPPIGAALFTRACDFVAGAADAEALPEPWLTEVAFCGRSNVGKSSLLNALTGRTKLARTSRTPGHTRQLNFFNLADTLMLVDLPGYGYAKASKTQIRGWTKLTFDYLKGRPNLRRVCLLVDSRHGLKPADLDAMRAFDDAAVSYQLILTKTDKCPAGELTARIEDITAALATHPAAHPVVLTTSAVKGEGIAELRAALAELATH